VTNTRSTIGGSEACSLAARMRDAELFASSIQQKRPPFRDEIATNPHHRRLLVLIVRIIHRCYSHRHLRAICPHRPWGYCRGVRDAVIRILLTGVLVPC
jgi:hypothetical protein